MDDPALFEQGREAGLPSNLPIDGHSFRRVEVLTGTPRRRRWSAAEKAAIVSESLAPGAVASTIALRHGLAASQSALHLAAGAAIRRAWPCWRSGSGFCADCGGTPCCFENRGDRDRWRWRCAARWPRRRVGVSWRDYPAAEDN